ncbi:caspase, EACC1-associated type [Frankia sp. Cas4]|uniref:caspase, EACC1-associated type n=1 Tax=Frankia sp. Cas4 TaxID=3073927 RepID=UPI002AD2EC39|nr:caspase family protein [Frankia sp. Cas4]
MERPDPPPDFARSQAVLLGTSTYTHLPAMPAALNSLRAMKRLLTGPLCGWPADRVATFPDLRGTAELTTPLRLVRDTTDVVFFYYVGHGQPTLDEDLCMGLVDTAADPTERELSSLLMSTLRRTLGYSQARVKVVVLDCCFSGIATENRQGDPDQAAYLAGLTRVRGAYTLTASEATSAARYGDGPVPLTQFTRNLVDLVDEGIPGQPPHLTLDGIFPHLNDRLARQQLPQPTRMNIRDGGALVFARNAAPPDTHLDPDLEIGRLRRQIAEAEARENALHQAARRQTEELETLRRLAHETPQTQENRLDAAMRDAAATLATTVEEQAHAHAEHHDARQALDTVEHTRPDDSPHAAPPHETVPPVPVAGVAPATAGDPGPSTPTRSAPLGQGAASHPRAESHRFAVVRRNLPAGRAHRRSWRAMALATALAAAVATLASDSTVDLPGRYIAKPYAVAFGGGTVYVVDDNQIDKIDWTGRFSTFAGTGPYGFSGDGGPATQAQLYGPLRVAVGGDGTVYISDGIGNRIRKVDTAGRISTFAGTGTGGFSGDGGPATQAQLYGPSGVAAAGDGTVYIADSVNGRIRKIDTAGRISTFAGTASGRGSFSGDGGPATQAQLNEPLGVAVARDGTVYVNDIITNDFRNRKIYKIDMAGRISTFAGTGISGFSGDGGPATQAQLNDPFGMAVGGDGTVYIADTDNNRIRKIDTAGRISTFAGTGSYGFSGDGGPATRAKLASPWGVAVGGDGTVYIADTDNNRIRKIDTKGRISTLAQ